MQNSKKYYILKKSPKVRKKLLTSIFAQFLLLTIFFKLLMMFYLVNFTEKSFSVGRSTPIGWHRGTAVFILPEVIFDF